jgi:DNA-binding transcriptional ArsR family regulator
MTGPSHELQALKAEFFRAMAHPMRIRILEVLSAKGEQSVQALQQHLDVDQPIVSQHLAKLRAHGVVSSRKEGTTVNYALADPRIAELLKVAKEILNRRLTGTRTLLHELRRHG